MMIASVAARNLERKKGHSIIDLAVSWSNQLRGFWTRKIDKLFFFFFWFREKNWPHHITINQTHRVPPPPPDRARSQYHSLRFLIIKYFIKNLKTKKPFFLSPIVAQFFFLILFGRFILDNVKKRIGRGKSGFIFCPRPQKCRKVWGDRFVAGAHQQREEEEVENCWIVKRNSY